MTSTPTVPVSYYQQIVSVLCTTAPLTDTALLQMLVLKYPATGWTLPLLDSYLASGRSNGLLKAIGSYAGGPVAGWSLNKDAIRMNYANTALYVPNCPTYNQIPTVCSAARYGTRDADT